MPSSPTRPTLRMLTTADASALAALHGRCFSYPWNADSFGALFAGPGLLAWGHVLAAPQPGAVPDAMASLCLVRQLGDDAEILTLAVDPPWRRQGLAAALLSTATTALLALGGRTLWLEVADGNLAAQRLYDRHGFREVGRRKAYYRAEPGRPPGDALVLGLDLPLLTPGPQISGPAG